MKILHLANVIGEHKGGGVHEVVSNFYKYQKLLQHEPHIWFPGADKDADTIKLDNNIRGLETFGDAKFGVIKDVFKSIPKEIESFDIIHQHGIWMPISIYNIKVRKKTKLKSVVQPHGYLLPYSLGLSKFKKKLAFLLFEKDNLKSADALVACAMEEAIILKEMFPKKEVAIIPNGISEEFFNESQNINKPHKLKKRLLFLSQIIPVKGIERVLYGIKHIGTEKFSDWEFIIAGYENTNYKKKLLKLIAKFNLNNFVSFVGPKFGKDKIDLFDSADVFILPSFNENYGIVVAEALARGIPVLTTKGTPWKELNTNKCGFWVDNTNEGIMAGLLEMLSTSQKELHNMGIRGRELIESKYLWSKTTLKTIELYEWVINGGKKPGFFI